jgi:hypothetical protein
MTHSTFRISVIAAVFLVLAACNVPGRAPAVETPDFALTASAQALQAQWTQSAVVTPSTTFSPSPSLTPSPTGTGTAVLILTMAPPATNRPPVNASPVCDKAQFVRDVTIPDGTIVSPGATIVKTWQLKNVGSCTWTTAYSLVFSHGQQMGPSGSVPSPVALPNSVAPGQTVDLTVQLIAPAAPGSYQADFQLRSASGSVFGVGSSGRGTFWVKITVPPATPTTPSYP